MTIFGWDASHYDGTLTKDILTRAKSEGIQFFSHKIGEGVSVGDPTQGTALAAARDAGIEVLGAYWFIHGNDSPDAEVTAMVKQLDANEPWWRAHPYFFIQCDAETSATGLPIPHLVMVWCEAAAKATGKTVVCYASNGMYGDSLIRLGHPLWNANYGSNRTGKFASVYPGDNSAGWDAYSGQTPAILQFGSNATIAGLKTCDANAFRGTLDQLKQLVGGTGMADGPSVNDIWTYEPGWPGLIQETPLGMVNETLIDARALRTELDAVKAQCAANGNALSQVLSMLSVITSNVAKIPTSAAVATLSESDKAAIVQGVLDGLEGRLAS